MHHRFALVAALAAAPAFAQSLDLAELDPLQVTATLEESRVSETLASVIVITRAEIERSQAPDLADLLRFHAGLDVARNGGPGQAASVFIRGAESNHTLVLVDGVRINPGTIGGAALQNLSPELIERIEIVKGPRSSQWGSDAIGGVIHVITRRPGSGLSGQARAMAGGDETWGSSLSLSGRGAAAEGGVTLDRFATRGFPAQQGLTEDTGHERTAVSAFGAVSLGGQRFAARHWETAGSTDYFDFTLSRVDQDFRNSASALEWSAPLAGADATVLLTHAADEAHQNQSSDYALTRRAGAEARAAWRTGLGTSTLGAQAYREAADSQVFGSGFDVRTDAWSGFAQQSLDAGPQHALLAARYGEHEAFGGHWTGNAEYGLDVWSGARAVLSAGTGFRAPDATDRFGFGGRPDLQPEESRNLELGLRQAWTGQTLSLALFDSRIDNLIEFVCFDALCFSGENRNVARARIRGAEAQWRWRAQHWSGGLEAVVQDPVDDSSGERLARRAGKSLSASLVRRAGPFELGTDLLAQGRREDSAFSTTVNAGYALWNLTAGWQAWRGLALQARIENLLDRNYETAAGFAAPGRSGFLTLRYALR